MKIIQFVLSSLPLAAGLIFGGPIYGEPPTSLPSLSPTDTCKLECQTDYDCPRVCKKEYQQQFGTCVGPSTPPMPFPTTRAPTLATTRCPCDNPKEIPDKCEVDILIDLLEVEVLAQPKLSPQWLRAAFHDAGTFDQTMPEGGANGCLLTHLPMRLQDENQHLNQPLLTLEDIKNFWHADPSTCIKVSSADILQFAAFFATTRQKHTPESILSTSTAPTAIAKRNTLKNDFLWGRPDESNCDVAWTDNLPGFATPANAACSGAIICRCTAAGDEINIKMIKRNGFTATEANALIGAHTIGLIRHKFGPSLPVSSGDAGTEMGISILHLSFLFGRY